MQLRTSERKSAKIRLSLQGPSGSGKTYSALLIAFGLVGDWSKIAVIDTERGSADLYAHLGNYFVLPLTEPYTPERYIEAIKLCENSGIECVIIDSCSHEWSGKGGCLEIHEEVTSKMRVPNSFTAWASVTPKHQAFIDAILQSKSHVITTLRSKTEYVLAERNGKQQPQKVGMAAVTRDGFEYEVTISLDIDDEHNAISSKDRTELFSGKGKFRITSNTGKVIRDWCNSGALPTSAKVEPVLISESITEKIKRANSIENLYDVYLKHQTEWKKQLTAEYTTRKRELNNNIPNLQNFSNNGHATPSGTA